MLKNIYILALLSFSLLFSALNIHAQEAEIGYLLGKVTDASNGRGIELATVYVEETGKYAETDLKGFYTIKVPANKDLNLACSRIGFDEAISEISALAPGERRRVNIKLLPLNAGFEVEVTESRIEDAGMISEEVTELKLLPTTTGNFETLLPHIALGTSSGTGGELSSQYNVRGGNYDENLVYVNDFQIYRPQLIRTGQQEGLTFPNIDLTKNLSFSSGGFEARYGDKMSSVLDVRYKRPDSTRASIGMSFLGGSAHLEGSIKADSVGYRRFRYLLGARYKTTRYLLGSLDIQGEYIPNFFDGQVYLTYDLSRDWQLGVIGNINRSEYSFVPSERSTAFGQINLALELFTVYEGQEVDDFTTYMGGVSLTYLPERDINPYYLKFLASTTYIQENERFDILGFYRLGQVESDLGSDDFGEVVSVLGTGTQQEFVRNSLQSIVSNVEHKGGIEFQGGTDDWRVSRSNFLQWGVKYQREIIADRINEWNRLDSAGYSLPYDPNEVRLESVFKSENDLESNRFSGFIQNTFSHQKDSAAEWRISAGVRANYWDLNDELVVSPRVQFQIKPLNWKKDFSFRLAAGLYAQPPFYRELRNIQGIVNTNVRAQKSFHVVGGFTHDFLSGKKDPKRFRFIVEAYYKRLWDLVSYEIDNVRIRYSGQNDAEGYILGLDMRLNGEFVPGAESWINLSFLSARERLNGVDHLDFKNGEVRETKTVPRPTDQFMTLAMFFQDYFRDNENFKMHLNFTLGTGLPFGFPEDNIELRNSYRFSPYHRIDIGFSLLLWEQGWKAQKPKHPLRFTRYSWISLEVFNLMQVSNTASNTWVKTVFDQYFAVPNFLTSRRINLRLRMEF